MRIDGKGLIDRLSPTRFRFDGQEYQGFEGDTLASALLANNVRLMGRSFRYHRPRGVLTAGSEEPNALVEVIEAGQITPNTRATVQEIYHGLEAKGQNRWPGPRRWAAGPAGSRRRMFCGSRRALSPMPKFMAGSRRLISAWQG